MIFNFYRIWQIKHQTYVSMYAPYTHTCTTKHTFVHICTIYTQMHHRQTCAPHAPPNTCVHHQTPPKYKIYLVGLRSELYERPGQNERSVLRCFCCFSCAFHFQVFFMCFSHSGAFHVIFIKSIAFHEDREKHKLRFRVITKCRSFNNTKDQTEASTINTNLVKKELLRTNRSTIQYFFQKSVDNDNF